jgi:hypothetical protein
MSHPLLEKLSGVRRRARRLLVLYGACWVLAAVLLTIVLAGLCDFLFRFEDPGIRLMVSAAVAGVLAWSVSRYLWPALGTRLTDLDVALRIERRYPALAERLSSTVQFLHEAEDDPAAGSALLRRSVITQTTSQIEAYDLADAVQSRPTRRVALAALGVLLVAGMIASLSPELSRIALARLANPLGSVAWPQQNHLQWKEEVRRVALGQPLELAVVDARGARLPAEVRLRLRFAAGGGRDDRGRGPHAVCRRRVRLSARERDAAVGVQGRRGRRYVDALDRAGSRRAAERRVAVGRAASAGLYRLAE